MAIVIKLNTKNIFLIYKRLQKILKILFEKVLQI